MINLTGSLSLFRNVKITGEWDIENHHDTALDTVGNQLFQFLAEAFPICCASDEFFFFPQIPVNFETGQKWDLFDPDKLTDVIRELSHFSNRFKSLQKTPLSVDESIDADLLSLVVTNLRHQLAEVGFWKTQPTFYLTIASIGLATAMESGDAIMRTSRASGLAGFLEQAENNLTQIPIHFRDLGLEMIHDLRKYLVFLEKYLPEIQPAFPRLLSLERKLQNISVSDNSCLQFNLFEQILPYHTAGIKDIKELNHILDLEIQEMDDVMKQEAVELSKKHKMSFNSDDSWQKMYESIPVPELEFDDPIRIYCDQVKQLSLHCQDQALIPEDFISRYPVKVQQMPPTLSAIRTASSYSFSPGYPSSKGKFYIKEPFGMGAMEKTGYREYKMLCAHETFPGHHVLDSFRWSNERPIRRSVEQPVFYEGWACFAESLMRITGYFSEPEERFLLAKRRYWRAVRGKVDLGLHAGTMDLTKAAEKLQETGIDQKQALSISKKYHLNPGYQLCYTMGVRRFIDLFNRFGKNNQQNFARTTLTQGEIGFTNLEKIFESAAG